MSVLTRTAHRCVLVGLVLTMAVGCSGDADPEAKPPLAAASGTTTPSTVPVPAPAPADDAPAAGDGTLGRDGVRLDPSERKQVEQGVDDFVRGHHDALSEPRDWAGNDDVHVPGVAGSALSDLLVTSEEYARNGWRVVGEPRVVAQQVVRRVDDVGGVVVRVCIDNSDVHVEEEDGTTVPHSSGRGRTLNVVTVSELDGEWVVTSQRVARRPDC